MLTFLQDNLAIVTLLALTILVLVILGLIVWAAIRGAQAEEKKPESEIARLSADSLRASFKRAVELVEDNIAARPERYSVPWVLVVNEKSSGHSLPLADSGIQSALSSDTTLTAAAQGIAWNFFDQGLVVQLQGDALGPADAQDGESRTWDEFLTLCRDYRPDRPFDALVVSLPASLLMRDDPQAALEIGARAKTLHRRLWLAQNRFALRFPIYVVVNGCDHIPGFARFAAALPEALRRSMLGWSVPYELAATYRSEWVDEAMDTVCRSLSDACAELAATQWSGADGSDYFLLPTEIQRVRSGLRSFMDELMRPSVYHEPFILRGLYLCGDSSDAAALAAANRQDNEALDPTAVDANIALQPAFLRDVFESKIFAESGLVRPTTHQRLRRPALSLGVRWAATAVVGVWVIGLAYNSVRLNKVAGELAVAIQKLDQDTADAFMSQRNHTANAADERKRAMDAIQLLSQVDGGALGSVFMPGSWSWFDDLETRVQRRLEDRFSENSIDPIRRGIYAKVAELTGVPTDPVSGEIIVGSVCTLPSGWTAAVEARPYASVAIEDAPELIALLQFMGRVEQLDLLLRARAHLVSGSGAPSGADLKFIVQSVFGMEITGAGDVTAGLFRKYAKRLKVFNTAGVQAAVSCSYGLAHAALARRVLTANELLRLEQAISEQSSALLSGTASPEDAPLTLGEWRMLLDDIRRQEELIQEGKGAWMSRRTMAFGPAYDGLVARAKASALIGPTEVDANQAKIESTFTKFRSDWDAALGADREGVSSPLAWSDKDGRWLFSEDRAALKAGLSALLGQPWVNAPRRAHLTVPSSLVSWDRAKLEQALSLQEVRKRFQADLLPKFPADWRAVVERTANRLFAESTLEWLSQAASITPRGGMQTLPDGETVRLTRIQMFLHDLGARASAEQLGAALVADSLTRLRLLDESLQKADILMPKSSDLREWTGEKGPMLAAFGVNDQVGLGLYLSEQVQRIEQLAKEAEPLLALADGTRANGPLWNRWSGIVNDLVRYRSKSPTSSLMALEQFVTSGAADLDRSNCADKPAARSTRRGGDFFTERLSMLQSGLAERCKELRVAEQLELWNQFAEGFNARLQGRIPFAISPPRGSGSPAAALANGRPPLDVDELSASLKQFDRAYKALERSGEPSAAKLRPPAEIRAAADQMERVRAFLAPLFVVDDATASGLDVSVEFRANAASEIEGNKIIDWSLSIGSQVLRRQETPRALRWEPGMPVTIRLRLAKDGPLTARTDSSQPWLIAEDKTLTYRFNDPWALQSLLMTLREPDEASRADRRTQLIKLEFPATLAGETAVAPVSEVRARVYVRLSISAAGKRAPLAWPGAFPSRMPEWAAK